MLQVDSVRHKLPELKNPRAKKRPLYTVVLVDTFSIIFFSCICFIIVNLPAYLHIIKYKLDPDQVLSESPEVNFTQQVEYPQPTSLENNRLIIPAIGVSAPIIWDVSADESVEKLQQGVIHINSTGKPNENKNVFLSGHSSNYWWREGDYNSVFALLPQLSEGNEVFVIYENIIYKYIIDSREEVEKNASSKFLNFDSSRLTLMTCTPVGTNLKRLVIGAAPSDN
jgi:LPXTG-site transpeptidase (sortase) family protein